MDDKNKYIDKFKETHNWNEYCYASKLKRIERLKEQGVINPWSVANNGEEPKNYFVNIIGKEGRLVIPAKFRKSMNINCGDEVKVTMVDNKMILEKVVKDE